jgi:hypothetical protein
MASSDSSDKGWIIVVAILVILFLGTILALSNWAGVMTLVGRGESDSTLYLYELNQSVAPQGNMISLTEEDFKTYPKLAPVIRDNKQKPIQILKNGNRLYTIPLTMEERYDYYPLVDKILEYEGKYYSYGIPEIH